MMTRRRFKGFFPVILFFILLNAFFISGKKMLDRWGADQEVLIIGNLVLFLITLISFLLTKRGISHSNPNVFVRSVYGSMMVKLFGGMIAAFVYISMHKGNLNKPALFGCMGLFLVYTFMEVGVLMKMLKEAKHG